MQDFLKAHGITIGIVILGIIAIYFYGNARYKSGRSDLLAELEKAPAETVKTHTTDTLKIVSRGEARGKPEVVTKWRFMDSCDYTPYLVEVTGDSIKGEVICFPEKQTARWDLKADCPQNVFTITQTKYFEKDLGFWFQVLGGYSNQPLAGGIIGYKSVGIGVLAEDKPIWVATFKWEL